MIEETEKQEKAIISKEIELQLQKTNLYKSFLYESALEFLSGEENNEVVEEVEEEKERKAKKVVFYIISKIKLL